MGRKPEGLVVEVMGTDRALVNNTITKLRKSLNDMSLNVSVLYTPKWTAKTVAIDIFAFYDRIAACIAEGYIVLLADYQASLIYREPALGSVTKLVLRNSSYTRPDLCVIVENNEEICEEMFVISMKYGKRVVIESTIIGAEGPVASVRAIESMHQQPRKYHKWLHALLNFFKG